jgi:hypothetical protein
MRCASILLAFLPCLGAARAQCSLEWTSGGPQLDLTGLGQCSTLWDPDGAGPLPQRLVIGGGTLSAANAIDQRVVTWDGTQWEALGPGPGTSGNVRAMVSWNGTLVAAGDFTGGGLTRIAQWSGAAWQTLGAGLPAPAYSLAVWNGNLVAACAVGSGAFLTADIRTWNGTSWSGLPAPPTLQAPLALASYQGLLCVGGHTASNGGVLERWNGTSWAASISANNWITSLVVKPTTVFGGTETLFAGGFFTTIGLTAAPYVAATLGGSTFAWNSLSGGLATGCKALHVRGYGVGLSSYVLTAVTNVPAHAVKQLNVQFGGPAATWTTIDTQLVDSVSYYGNAYHAASSSSSFGAGLRYNGIQWLALHGPGVDEDVRAATSMGNDVIVGGRFSNIAGTAASAIARWDGNTFQTLGTGMTGEVVGEIGVDALCTLANGDIVAGGQFVFAGPMNANCIARWNGSAWSTFGTGMNQQVLAVAELPNGNLVAGGWFTIADGLSCMRIARWDGSQWQPFGAGANGSVQALVVRQDGVLFAAGGFSSIGGVACNRIAQWNGTSWAPVGRGCNSSVFALAVRPNGDIVAVGQFTTAGGVAADRCARWNGSAWLAMGTASVDPGAPHAVLALANGDVVVSHGFHTPSSLPDEGISRWNGTTWSALGTFTGAVANDNLVWCLAQRSNGELVVGGDFRRANGVISRNLAALRSTCAPLATSFGTGCSGAAGQLVITADTLPWIGAAFRTTTTGVAPGSPGVGLIGLTQLSIPLPTLLPEGQPGCSLYTTPDAQLLLTNGPGDTATSSFALGNDASLIGVPFFQQTIALEFGAGGAITAIRGSNALSLVIGTL